MNKRFRHFKTVCKHKWYVFQECCKCGIVWQGITHDLSKFSAIEFGPSAEYFQGDRSPIEAEKEACGYSLAWLHHKGVNPHHWEYWIDFDENGNIIANKMPWEYVIEMICDWIGAGKAYNTEKWTCHEPLAYYNKVRKGRHFHSETERLIEAILREIDRRGVEALYEIAKNEYTKLFYESTGVIFIGR